MLLRIALLLMLPTAAISATYTYTGAKFETIEGENKLAEGGYCDIAASHSFNQLDCRPPYTTDMQVTASFSIDGYLLPNTEYDFSYEFPATSNIAYRPAGFQFGNFSDGINDFSPDDLDENSLVYYVVETNSLGQISAWDLWAYVGPGSPDRDTIRTQSSVGDEGFYLLDENPCNFDSSFPFMCTFADSSRGSTSVVGTWTITPPLQTVPIPASAPLLALGLGALALKGRRATWRKRYA